MGGWVGGGGIRRHAPPGPRPSKAFSDAFLVQIVDGMGRSLGFEAFSRSKRLLVRFSFASRRSTGALSRGVRTSNQL